MIFFLKKKTNQGPGYHQKFLIFEKKSIIKSMIFLKKMKKRKKIKGWSLTKLKIFLNKNQ